MIKTFKSSSETIFITKKSKVNKRGSYNVILSPQFYWVKKVKLPVDSIRAAKKLAKSVFENSLPNGNFSYHVQKSGDEFIIIAYDKEEISKEFEKIFLDKKDIKGVYFAQNELKELKECSVIDAFSALTKIDGLILQIPRACLNGGKSVDSYLKDISLSKNRVDIKVGNGVNLSKKTISLLVGVFVLFLIAYLIEYLSYKSELKKLQEQKVNLIKEYDLPRTMIQIRSIKNSLLNIYKEQKKIKDALYKLSKVKFNSGESIKHIEIDENGLSVDVEVSSTIDTASLKNRFSKEFTIKDWIAQANIVTIKMEI